MIEVAAIATGSNILCNTNCLQYCKPVFCVDLNVPSQTNKLYYFEASHFIPSIPSMVSDRVHEAIK